MKMQTLQKSARTLSVLLKITGLLVGALGVLLAACMVVGFLLAAIADGEARAVMEAAVGSGSSVTGVIFFFVCCEGMLLCVFFALSHAKKLFDCIGNGESPFTPNTSGHLRKIVILVLVYTGISLAAMFPLDSTEILSVLLGFVFALILFCVSLIFDYGSALQKEVDELL